LESLPALFPPVLVAPFDGVVDVDFLSAASAAESDVAVKTDSNGTISIRRVNVVMVVAPFLYELE